jgi:SAM-dependent methyltransferase
VHARISPTVIYSNFVRQQAIFKEFLRAMKIEQANFPDSIRLPPLYGKGMPERSVEILLARLLYRPGIRILDVGHANSMKCHLSMIDTIPRPRNITGIDISKPVFNVNAYYDRSIEGDITSTSLPDGSFDLIWCISALEHFGMDNSTYTGEFTVSGDLDFIAIKEMIRLLAKNGTLLITVPYGRYEDHGSYRNYDGTRWQKLLGSISDGAHVKTLYFKHTHGNGWTVGQPDELRYAGYFDQANNGAAAIAAAIITK